MEFLEKRKVPYAVTALVGVNVLYFLYLLLTGSLSGMSLVQEGSHLYCKWSLSKRAVSACCIHVCTF